MKAFLLFWYNIYVFSKHSKVYFSNFKQGFETQHVSDFESIRPISIITNYVFISNKFIFWKHSFCFNIILTYSAHHTKHCIMMIMISYTFILWKHLSYFNTMLTYSARIWNHIEPNTRGWQGIEINCDSIISLYLMLSSIESLHPLIMLT